MTNINNGLHALILAAGKSKRMKSEKSKIVHKILGKTIIEYVVDALAEVPVEKIAIVVGEHNYNEIYVILKDRVEYIFQNEALGTGHAVQMAKAWLKKKSGSVFIVVGDAPFISSEIMKELYLFKENNNLNCAFLSSLYENPPPYGRVVRDNENKVKCIVEEKDATNEQKKIKEVSSSHYCFDIDRLIPALSSLSTNNVQKEYYLTDVIEIFYSKKLATDTFPVENPVLTFGINNREDMAKGIAFLREKIIQYWMKKGVTIIDSSNTYIEHNVKIETDTVIYPFTYLSGNTIIGKGSNIGPFVFLDDEKIPEMSTIKNNIRHFENEHY